MSSGSGESLKLSLRCGCKPKACRIRLMVRRLSLVALASSRVLQCVCPRGVLSRVLNHHLLDLVIADCARSSGARLVVKPFQPSSQEAATPLAAHTLRAAHLLRHGLVVESLSTGQHHSRPSSQQGPAACPMGQRLEPIMLFVSQNQRLLGSPGSHLSLLHFICNPVRLSSLISGTVD
jgi:hypothetical protein